MSSYNYALDIDQFFNELLAGQLGVQARPATTLAVFDLYQAWASHNGLLATGSPRLLVQALRLRHAVPVARKRYAIGKLIHQGSFIFLTTPPPAPPGYEADSMGEHVAAFAAAIASYRARTAVSPMLEKSVEVQAR